MNLIVKNITVPLEHELKDIYDTAIRKAKVQRENIKKICIHKKSIDARGKSIKFVYSICINLFNKESFNKGKDIEEIKEFKYDIKQGKALLAARPIIIGLGPAGLFCAYLLCLYGFKPIVFERGKNVEERRIDVEAFFKKRIFNPESNIQFGEGGAGTFSDGKLITRINDERCGFVLNTFHKFGAKEDILYEANPHIGTDYLIKIIKNIREEIIRLGGEIHFNKKVTDIIIKKEKIKGVKLADDNVIDSEIVVLAIGHSARDTFYMLNDNKVLMEKKPFSAGFRIEHLREFIDKSRYHEFYHHKNLGSASYQLSVRKNDRGCYSFCMCPGGYVIAASSEENMVVTNGMSENKRDAINSNSAIVASVLPKDLDSNLFSGIEFQRRLEKAAFSSAGCDYSAPVQLSKDYLSAKKSSEFLSVKPSYPCGTSFVDLNQILPDFLNDMLKFGLMDFDKKIKGFSTGDAVLTGVETRTSSPLRITRGDDFTALGIGGLYPAGEGAGYAGGITSACVDGLKTAQKIIEKYKPI